MTPHEFVLLWKAEKESLLEHYFAVGSKTAVAAKIAALSLDQKQSALLREVVDGVLIDAFYGLLLGLDGCASIGGRQIDYQLADEEGNLLTGPGEIEGEAWEAFHGD